MPNDGYQPYPVYDFKVGKVTTRDPWLLPPDAFEIIRNAHLRNGILEKRKGYIALGRIVHTTTTTTPATNSNPGHPVMGIHQYENDTDKYMLAMDAKRTNEWNDGSSAFVDVTRRMIHVKHGGVQDHAPVVGDTLTGGTSTAEAEIESIFIDHGTIVGTDADLWILFTKAAITNGPFQSGEQLTDATGGAGHIFGVADGADSDYEFTLDPLNTIVDYSKFFWMVNWNNVAYLCNGHATDRVCKYGLDDASTYRRLTPLQIDLDVEGGPDNDVLGARGGVIFHGSLCLFGTVENGAECPRRLRWCTGNDPLKWPANNYLDCPTGDRIRGVMMLQDTPIVFFEKSTWIVVYTGNPTTPFDWVNISTFRGSEASGSPVELPTGMIMAMNGTMLIGATRSEVGDMGVNIREFPMTFNLDMVSYMNGSLREEDSQVWMSYAESAQNVPTAGAAPGATEGSNSVLVGNYLEKGWATYELPAHCFGRWQVQSDTTLDSIEAVLDTLDYSFDDLSLSSGYPLTVFGTIGGYIRQASNGGTDNGSDIDLDIRGKRWNPFYPKGYKCWLGWVDILADADEDVSISVAAFVDTYGTAHTTQTITFDGGPIGGKVLKRAFLGPVQGEFHRLRIYHTASNQRPRIHAIIPWFKRGSRLLA